MNYRRKLCHVNVGFLQSFDISHQQYQWVLDHLGHTTNVHKAHYRAMSDVIERAEVAKLLLIQYKGLVGKYHGKRLQDIPIEGEILFKIVWLCHE